MACDPEGANWLLTGSSVGRLTLWDTRFQLPVFALGIVLYFFRKEIERLTALTAATVTTASLRSWSLLSLLASAGLIWASWPTRDKTLFLSSIGLFFWVVALGLHPWRLVVNPITIYLGRISYSIYLTHFFVVIAVDGLLHPKSRERLFQLPTYAENFFVVWLAVLLGAVLIGTITYHTIEAPFIAYGRRLAGKFKSKAIALSQL
jgi:peptidoglycan/LPS O-acetylase OafA/YrhL